MIPDETAFNNSCDLGAARHVYAECQQHNVPTTTLSRHCAYGCPLNVTFLDNLQKTHHILAGEIRTANLKALQELWKKVNMPAWLPGRGKLPARCNREWFLEFFKVDVDDTTYTSTEPWKNCSLFLYDSLAMINTVEAYSELHFTPKCYKIDGTVHKVMGLNADVSCVANSEYLVNEIEGLLSQALKVSLKGMDSPPPKKKSESSNGKDSYGEKEDEKKDTV